MIQKFETFVPTLKHKKLIATAQAKALENDKIQDAKILKQAQEEAVKYFEQYRFWWFNGAEMVYDRETGYFWHGNSQINLYKNPEATIGQLENWQVPSNDDIAGIIETELRCNHSDGTANRLIYAQWTITQTSGSKGLLLDYEYSTLSSDDCEWVLGVNKTLITKRDALQILAESLEKKWALRPHDTKSNEQLVEKSGLQHFDDYLEHKDFFLKNPCGFHSVWNEEKSYHKEWKKLSEYVISQVSDELQEFYKNLSLIESLSKKSYDYTPEVDIAEVWQDIDYLSTRLPKLDKLRFTDVEQGIWEFHTHKSIADTFSKVESKQYFRERDPVLDIRQANVAIDFGTSSTVVAIRENGQDELLRIGVQEQHFGKDEITDEHYENPTILEFLNLQKFMQDWHSEAQRPLVNWDDIHCSHEARASLRNNDTTSQVVSSILLRLKQWALRTDQQRVRLNDQQGFEYQREIIYLLKGSH